MSGGLAVAGSSADRGGNRGTMRKLIVAIGACLALAMPAQAQAQVRTYPDDVFTDILLLRDVIFAYVQRIDVDDPAALAANFTGRVGLPDRTLADFDRNRNGVFYALQDARGLFDTDFAILQFIHDIVDADQDGLLGFYEIECAFAGGPTLDPDNPATFGGVPDGDVDCDGDGMANLVELRTTARSTVTATG